MSSIYVVFFLGKYTVSILVKKMEKEDKITRQIFFFFSIDKVIGW